MEMLDLTTCFHMWLASDCLGSSTLLSLRNYFTSGVTEFIHLSKRRTNKKTHSHRIHVWHIYRLFYQNLALKSAIHVGKYISPMDLSWDIQLGSDEVLAGFTGRAMTGTSYKPSMVDNHRLETAFWWQIWTTGFGPLNHLLLKGLGEGATKAFGGPNFPSLDIIEKLHSEVLGGFLLAQASWDFTNASLWSIAHRRFGDCGLCNEAGQISLVSSGGSLQQQLQLPWRQSTMVEGR